MLSAFLVEASWPLQAQETAAQPVSPHFEVPGPTSDSRIGSSVASSAIPPSPVESTDFANPPVASPCGYWIISTRECGTSFDSVEACRHEVFHAGEGGLERSSLEAWAASLPPGCPVCFMTHGSFVSWELTLRDSQETYRWLMAANGGRPLALVFFTWPSDEDTILPFVAEVNRLGRTAARHGRYLAELIAMIPSDHPVTLLGHSHGARMAIATAHYLGGGEIGDLYFSKTAECTHRIRIIVAAAAFDHDWIGSRERYDRAGCRAELIVNLRNRHDPALLIYPLRQLGSRRALAVRGFSRLDLRHSYHPEKLIDYDVTEEVGWHHTWPHFYDSPALATLISSLIAR